MQLRSYEARRRSRVGANLVLDVRCWLSSPRVRVVPSDVSRLDRPTAFSSGLSTGSSPRIEVQGHSLDNSGILNRQCLLNECSIRCAEFPIRSWLPFVPGAIQCLFDEMVYFLVEVHLQSRRLS